jgi:hypothetical protein
MEGFFFPLLIAKIKNSNPAPRRENKNIIVHMQRNIVYDCMSRTSEINQDTRN